MLNLWMLVEKLAVQVIKTITIIFLIYLIIIYVEHVNITKQYSLPFSMKGLEQTATEGRRRRLSRDNK